VGYIELGKDATIAYGELDLKFTNTTSYPITFKATCEDNIVTITATTKDKLPQS
jgi:vancomycin resistance protein YoaR